MKKENVSFLSKDNFWHNSCINKELLYYSNTNSNLETCSLSSSQQFSCTSNGVDETFNKMVSDAIDVAIAESNNATDD